MPCNVSVRGAFQLTPSARRATLPCLVTWSSHRYFNPRPPRGGRPPQRAPGRMRCAFQSTPSARRATRRLTSWGGVLKISIHALREEGDEKAGPCHRASVYFNPRSPWGERPAVESLPKPDGAISIHALREEGDKTSAAGCPGCSYFNPRPPRGGRPGGAFQDSGRIQISIHALREEGDCRRQTRRTKTPLFQSTPSARRATVLGK